MFLSLLSGNQKGRVIRIERDGILGRDPGVVYAIDDPTVSRRHAELLLTRDGCIVRDLGSANGTEINGARLTGERVLSEGDIVGLGRVTLQYTGQLAGTVRGDGLPAVAVEQTLSPACSDSDFVRPMLAAMRSEQTNAEAQAVAILQILIEGLPGAARASLVDWKAGRILARAPAGAEISRGTLFRALAALKSAPKGVAVWTADDCAALARSLSLPEIPSFIALPVEHPVGLLIEAGVEQAAPAHNPGLDRFVDVAMLLRIPLAAIRSQAAAASRKMRDSDLRLAQRIQQRLLTPPPEQIDGFELACSYTPAMMVGGDFFHIERHGEELAVLIGDVSGKGVSAAMYMAYLVADLRHQLKSNIGPAELLENLQRSLIPVLEPGMFVTVAAVFVNTRTGMCRVGLAGHSAPVLRTSARKVIEMGLDPGSPIGTDSSLAVREQRLALAPGDCLVLTTDGVEEGENSTGDPYGKARRDQVLISCDSAGEINQALRKSLMEFVGKDRSTDDLTIICLGRLRG
ncbi:MAG: FHA domain-containing protein [Xanthomonadales bacterium PRO6]|nr:hypothetical protein [Xanthomonadales bacterium]MCE7931469.1 FHA domain-containing protein [Xanthomonadales bacterium PRO6]